MLNSAQKFVATALADGQLTLHPEGRILKSKRESPYFFDSAKFNSGKSIANLASAYARVAGLLEFDVLYGPPYKGTLLAPAVAAALWTYAKLDKGWSSSRKEAKDHAEGGIMLGAPLKGKKVGIIDDVITTGVTKGEAVDLVQEQGGEVVWVVVAFDRMETAPDSTISAAQQFTKDYGVPVYSTANLNDLITVLRQDTDFPNNPPGMLGKILAYKETYGVK
jgi:orotate phosphoribosyltransferase